MGDEKCLQILQPVCVCFLFDAHKPQVSPSTLMELFLQELRKLLLDIRDKLMLFISSASQGTEQITSLQRSNQCLNTNHANNVTMEATLSIPPKQNVRYQIRLSQLALFFQPHLTSVHEA